MLSLNSLIDQLIDCDNVSHRSYLNRGVVEKLEVVNKKWVRVVLSPGSTTDGSVREEEFDKSTTYCDRLIICLCLPGRALVQHRQRGLLRAKLGECPGRVGR